MNPVNSLGLPYKRADLVAAFTEVLNSGQYAEGVKGRTFESMLADVVGTQHAVALNSCGSALLVLFKFLKSKGAKNVAVQNNTFYATGAMAQMAGLEVFVVDSGDQCPSMGIDGLREVTKQVSIDAVILTHVGGMVAQDYAKIADHCKEIGAIFLEDCAHALGVKDKMGTPGQYGYASCWSFYPTKAVPIGEGGALTTNDPELVEFAKRYRAYGKHVVNGVIEYEAEGMNLRMDEFAAAIAIVQLENLEGIIAGRKRDARKLLEVLPRMFNDRPSNFYKYIVREEPGWKTTGAVYRWSDQLVHCLKAVNKISSMKNSSTWAESHMCLPCGEGIYDQLQTPEIKSLLRQ